MVWANVEGGTGAFSSQMKSFKPSEATSWWYLPYDQLNLDLLPNQESIGIILIESEKQAKRRPYHKQKLCYILSNMRHFAIETLSKGIPVLYVSTNEQYDEPLEALAQGFGPINMYRAAERELRLTLSQLIEEESIIE
ncbi:MAG: cryptochrome/photolyase family protein, partial [Candidatus Poseidoniaceae archaeon]